MAEGTKQCVHFCCWVGLSAHTRRKNYMYIGGKNLSVSREGNHSWFELLSKIFEPSNVMGCIPPLVCLWACKERNNSCMNRELLDRESLDRVSWTSTTPLCQGSEFAKVLNIPRSWICQCYMGFWICLNMSDCAWLSMPGYV